MTGVLSVSLTDAKLNDLISELLEKLQSGGMNASLRASHVQAIGVTSYVVGNRVGSRVADAEPLLLSQIEGASDEDIELLESCIRAFESFVSRSPLFSRPFLDHIIDVCVKFLYFDPNYAADMDTSDDEESRSLDEEDDMFVRSRLAMEECSFVRCSGTVKTRCTATMKTKAGKCEKRAPVA